MKKPASTSPIAVLICDDGDNDDDNDDDDDNESTTSPLHLKSFIIHSTVQIQILTKPFSEKHEYFWANLALFSGGFPTYKQSRVPSQMLVYILVFACLLRNAVFCSTRYLARLGTFLKRVKPRVT